MNDPEILEEEGGPEPFVPDDLSGEDIDRPLLGAQSTHAVSLWEEAALLGALRDALRKAGFDAEESWHLVSTYAHFLWTAKFERPYEFTDDDDD